MAGSAGAGVKRERKAEGPPCCREQPGPWEGWTRGRKAAARGKGAPRPAGLAKRHVSTPPARGSASLQHGGTARRATAPGGLQRAGAGLPEPPGLPCGQGLPCLPSAGIVRKQLSGRRCLARVILQERSCRSGLAGAVWQAPCQGGAWRGRGRAVPCLPRGAGRLWAGRAFCWPGGRGTWRRRLGKARAGKMRRCRRKPCGQSAALLPWGERRAWGLVPVPAGQPAEPVRRPCPWLAPCLPGRACRRAAPWPGRQERLPPGQILSLRPARPGPLLRASPSRPDAGC